MANKLNTYTQGFEIKAPTAITKDGMLRLCRALDQKFGEGNTFKPEGVGGGFLLWADWPGRIDDKAYKCMRLSGVEYHKWPWVSADAMTTWVGNHEVAAKAGRYTTFLKAFDTAPAWTRDELLGVQQCLEETHSCKVLCMPAAFRQPKRTPKRDVAPKRGSAPKRDIVLKRAVAPKRDIAPKRAVAPKHDVAPKRDSTLKLAAGTRAAGTPKRDSVLHQLKHRLRRAKAAKEALKLPQLPQQPQQQQPQPPPQPPQQSQQP